MSPDITTTFSRHLPLSLALSNSLRTPLITTPYSVPVHPSQRRVRRQARLLRFDTLDLYLSQSWSILLPYPIAYCKFEALYITSVQQVFLVILLQRGNNSFINKMPKILKPQPFLFWRNAEFTLQASLHHAAIISSALLEHSVELSTCGVVVV